MELKFSFCVFDVSLNAKLDSIMIDYELNKKKFWQ